MENQNDIHRELTSLPVGKLLWKYSVPAIVGTMVMSLYNVIDRIFIGQGVGADAISGLALTFPIMSLAGAIGMLVGLGASARISIVLGQNDKVKAEKILANSLVLSLSFAVCYLTFFSVYMDDILRSFGGSDRTIPYAREFLIYIMPGMLCTNLCYSFNNMMRASGYPGKAMYTMLIGAFSNLILAPIFIFWLDWGIKGAAIATDIAMAISAAFVMIHFFNPKSQLRFHRRYFKLEWGILFNIVSIGLAPFLVNVASSVINAIINTSLYRYGGRRGDRCIRYFQQLRHIGRYAHYRVVSRHATHRRVQLRCRQLHQNEKSIRFNRHRSDHLLHGRVDRFNLFPVLHYTGFHYRYEPHRCSHTRDAHRYGCIPDCWIPNRHHQPVPILRYGF